jgi:hypothetical protein
MGTALDLLGEMHTKGVLKPPIVPWRFTPPKRQTERIGAYGKRKKRERQPNAPRFTIGEVPGDAKQGAGSIGGSTQAWFKLRKLCYQDERLREAFDKPRTLRQSAGTFLPRSALPRSAFCSHLFCLPVLYCVTTPLSDGGLLSRLDRRCCSAEADARDWRATANAAAAAALSVMVAQTRAADAA